MALVDHDRASLWFMQPVDEEQLRRAGIKLHGGGPHQSKTMMLADLSVLLDSGHADDPAKAIVEDNLLGKPSRRAREATLYRLHQLYGIAGYDPIWRVLRALWHRDARGRPLLALLTALARDPTLRDSAAAVLDASPGERVRAPAFAAVMEATNPNRFSERMVESLSRNCASSWTQAGFLKGAVRKERVRSTPTPAAAAFAALLASLSGFGGQRLLESRWLSVMDYPAEDRFALLKKAEGLGLLRVRSAGDVLEIDVRRQMAETLGVPELVG